MGAKTGLSRTVLIFAVLVLCLAQPAFVRSDNDMVEITVEVTEINNSKVDDLGIQWSGSITAKENGGSDVGLKFFPDVPTLINSSNWTRSALQANLNLLVTKGAAQVLSKPKILTKSGTSARVLVGGEVPIVSSGVGGGTIQWKEYGIKAEILPKILQDNYIELMLSTEVSRLDASTAVSGNPGIVKSGANSTIKVKSGETITIAGMVQTDREEQTVGIPLLCEIPVLGVLFGKKEYVNRKNNLLIFVTPKILD